MPKQSHLVNSCAIQRQLKSWDEIVNGQAQTLSRQEDLDKCFETWLEMIRYNFSACDKVASQPQAERGVSGLGPAESHRLTGGGTDSPAAGRSRAAAESRHGKSDPGPAPGQPDSDSDSDESESQ
jgi:hypothetical protein